MEFASTVMDTLPVELIVHIGKFCDDEAREGLARALGNKVWDMFQSPPVRTRFLLAQCPPSEAANALWSDAVCMTELGDLGAKKTDLEFVCSRFCHPQINKALPDNMKRDIVQLITKHCMDFPDLFHRIAKVTALLPNFYVPSTLHIIEDLENIDLGFYDTPTKHAVLEGKANLRLLWNSEGKEPTWIIQSGGEEVRWALEKLLPSHPAYGDEPLFDISEYIDEETLEVVLDHFKKTG